MDNSIEFGFFVLTAIVICIMALFHKKKEPEADKPKLVVSNDGRHAYYSNSPRLYSLGDEDDNLEDYIPGLDELRDPDYNQ